MPHTILLTQARNMLANQCCSLSIAVLQHLSQDESSLTWMPLDVQSTYMRNTTLFQAPNSERDRQPMLATSDCMCNCHTVQHNSLQCVVK